MSIKTFFDLIEKSSRKFRLSKVNIMGLEITIDEDKGSIDERIKKIETAKQSLLEGLSAIEELEKEAEKNKLELEDVLTKLSEIKKDKTNKETELNNIRQITAADVSAFKILAGVPTENEKRKDKIVAFCYGVAASIIAAGIIWGVPKLIQLL